MVVYFKSRSAARNTIKNAKLVDNGKDAPEGKRYARDLSLLKNKREGVEQHLSVLKGKKEGK